ncbi:MAG: Lrp/AsnC family transcriptional regulator [Actinobacteria bacterium]|nr:Lrp/AsnC family transcriptional regulator [Actinomycetota bacterium]
MEELDALDRSIIANLQEDGRRSFRRIAENLEVPEGTVRFRVKRLQEQRAMRILAFVDPLQFGYEVSASVLISSPQDRHHEAIEALEAWPEIVYLSSCTGRANIYAHVVCAGRAELLSILTDRLAELPYLSLVETFTELDVHKARYVYPPSSAPSA